MVAVTRFFNRHVLGPDRMALLGKAMPAANDLVRGEHEKTGAAVEAKLRRHVAAKPPEPDHNVSLLEYLPMAEVDLGNLAADRLRRFLSAFRVEIHYDCRTRRATFRAERGASGGNEDGPAEQGGSVSRLRECPRRVPPNMGPFRVRRWHRGHWR
jgi:hypothetical protein